MATEMSPARALVEDDECHEGHLVDHKIGDDLGNKPLSEFQSRREKLQHLVMPLVSSVWKRLPGIGIVDTIASGLVARLHQRLVNAKKFLADNFYETEEIKAKCVDSKYIVVRKSVRFPCTSNALLVVQKLLKIYANRIENHVKKVRGIRKYLKSLEVYTRVDKIPLTEKSVQESSDENHHKETESPRKDDGERLVNILDSLDAQSYHSSEDPDYEPDYEQLTESTSDDTSSSSSDSQSLSEVNDTTLEYEGKE